MKRTIGVSLVLVLLASSIGMQVAIDGERSSLGIGSNGARTSAETAVRFLGGVRGAAAAYLWLKVDRLHEDFYGEDLSKEQELAPLYRIITWLDPSFADAYYVGSYLLFKFGRPREGWAFALEGVVRNPESSSLERNAGELALHYRKLPKVAIPHLKKAFTLAETDEDRLLALQSLRGAYRQAGMLAEAEGAKRTISLLEAESGLDTEEVIERFGEEDEEEGPARQKAPGPPVLPQPQ
ncbi:MAG: hypothetical protein ACYC1U_06685 [Candidatus Aquicultorales bacterium]